jgi:hypothetical protein
MVKVGSRGIVLILSFAILLSSCKKESIPVINKSVYVVTPQKKTKKIKNKRKIKLFKIFRKKVAS